MFDNLHKTISNKDAKIFKDSIVFFRFLLDEHDERLRQKVFAKYKDAVRPINEQEFLSYHTNCIKEIIAMEEKALLGQNDKENDVPVDRNKKVKVLSGSSLFNKLEDSSPSLKSNDLDNKTSESPNTSSVKIKKRKHSK